ncbi:MAG: IS66 family insertion sequence element accessory protein TnpB [Anaerohalosphaera sp.]|nr:IS66 family insertion sequence element accessory protein TnpB [Anaerohalosphaera sp.]
MGSFCGQFADGVLINIKILFRDRTGFIICYKRLEEGTFERLKSSPGKASLEVRFTVYCRSKIRSKIR